MKNELQICTQERIKIRQSCQDAFRFLTSLPFVPVPISLSRIVFDIEKNVNAPLEIAEHYFYSSERKYIEAAVDPGKAFFTLWTLKESYMKMTGRGMSLPLDSFEIVRKDARFVLGKSPEKPGFFRTMEFEDYIFSVCNESDFTLNQNEFFDIL